MRCLPVRQQRHLHGTDDAVTHRERQSRLSVTEGCFNQCVPLRTGRPNNGKFLGARCRGLRHGE